MSLLFKEEDIVSCQCEDLGQQLEATIYKINREEATAYVHFLHQDKRLDRWLPLSELKPFTGRHSLRWTDGSEERPSSQDVKSFEDLHRQVTLVRNIESITLGRYQIRTWYYSPFSFEPASRHLYICDICCRYFATAAELSEHEIGHRAKPPGLEIYRSNTVSIFEMQGFRQKMTCQSLCLLAKLFLDHKTLFYDVEGFTFYVLYDIDESGAHIAAYFSKEINSDVNILACIVVLPPYQNKGYGQMLISLSYEIARRSNRVGGPERPLSDLGKRAFKSYWRSTILELFKKRDIQSIDEIVKCTAIARADIVEILEDFDCLTKLRNEWELQINPDVLSKAIAEYDQKPKRQRIDPKMLTWMPEDEKNNHIESLTDPKS